MLVGILGCLIHAAPEFREQSKGYYNYVEHITAGTGNGLKEAVKTFYNGMVREHSDYPNYPEPLMAAGMVINREYWLATSGSYKKGPRLSKLIHQTSPTASRKPSIAVTKSMASIGKFPTAPRSGCLPFTSKNLNWKNFRRMCRLLSTEREGNPGASSFIILAEKMVVAVVADRSSKTPFQ